MIIYHKDFKCQYFMVVKSFGEEEEGKFIPFTLKDI